MTAELLLDTGAFVALADGSERRHADCVAVLENWHGAIVTTEAVLTETLYLVGPRWQAQKLCLEFFLRGAFVMVPYSQAGLKRAAALMERYRGARRRHRVQFGRARLFHLPSRRAQAVPRAALARERSQLTTIAR